MSHEIEALLAASRERGERVAVATATEGAYRGARARPCDADPARPHTRSARPATPPKQAPEKCVLA